MDIEVIDGKMFNTVVGNLAGFVDEATLKFSQEGLKIDALNKSHTMFINAEIKEDAFEGLNTLNEPLDITVDSSFLGKVLKRIGNNSIRISDDNSFGGLEITTITDNARSFEVLSIDQEYDNPTPPNIDYDLSFDIPYSFLKECMADIEITGTDRLCFDVSKDLVVLKGLSEMNKSHAEYHPIDWNYNGAGFNCIYSIDFLNTMMKFNIGKSIDLSMGYGLPLKASVSDVTGDHNVDFIIAPRIENDL